MRKGIILLVVFLWLTNYSLLAQDESDLPGQIAYIGSDYNVYMIENGDTTALTDDAGVENRRVYLWPTWSTDGRLAYFSNYVEDNDLFFQVLVSGDVVYESEEEIFNYAYWSPQNCSEGENCRDLAVLINDSRGLFVQLIRHTDEGATSTSIGRGGPFYYSWSPDGTRMLWQRNSDTLDIYDVEQDAVIETLEQAPGLFQSPGWSPIDDRFLVGSLNADDSTDLMIVSSEETQILAPSLEGVIAFQWSPDGTHIAFIEDYGELNVLNTETGESTAMTMEDGIFAFFWSPDSEQIAFVTLANPPGTFSAKPASQDETINLAWSILDITTGETQRFASFEPTQEMLYLFSYFDQFAQSHRLWSPDSRYLVYAGLADQNGAEIRIINVTRPEAAPLIIAEGDVAIWSFE